MSVRGRCFRVSAAAVLALSVFSYPASAQVSPREQVATSTPLSAIKIFNFGVINANYYRGAQPKAADVKALAALGVKTVIDLRNDGDRDANESRLVSEAGMKYVSLPMSTRETPTVEKVRHFLSLVNDPASQPVYVHCVEGRHRTGVMTAMYRMTGEGWTSDQAFKEMKDYRFGAAFLHPEFKKFVYAFKSDMIPSLTAPRLTGPALATTAPVTKSPGQTGEIVRISSGGTASGEASPVVVPAQ